MMMAKVKVVIRKRLWYMKKPLVQGVRNQPSEGRSSGLSIDQRCVILRL